MLLCVQNLELAINDDDAFFHFDYEYANGTGPPNFWYYGVLRDFHRFPTNMPPNYTAETRKLFSIHLWRLRTGLDFCGPFPPSAERVGTVNMRGMLGRRCWLSPFGCHFYALYLHRGDAIAVGDEDFFSGTEIPRNRNYQVGLMQITMGNNKGSSSETTMSLTRKDFALSAQPTPVNWQAIPSGIGRPKVECEHIHFVSATQFVLVTGTIEWVDQQSRRGPSFEGVDAKASRTQFHWISIDEANSIAYVSRIELPEPPLASRENFYIDDRRIYLHVRGDQDNRSAFVFYTLDWTRQLRVLNAETQQWEEFELDTRNSDFGIAEIVDDEGGTSADEFYSVRFDNGLLLRKHIDSVYSKQGGVVFIQLLPAQSTYIMRVMFKLSHLNVDARGSLMSVRIYPNVHDRVRVHLHIYVSPPYVAPLRYLAYWRLREMLQVNDRKEFDEEKGTMRSAAGYYKRMPAKHDPSSSGSLAIDELSVHNEKWAKLLQQADTAAADIKHSTMLYPIPWRRIPEKSGFDS
uniref:Uncharacterized protein n=1 Tax=Globodera rostochiensis TaxID=31243 RepID=A0A914I9N0_GLORO